MIQISIPTDTPRFSTAARLGEREYEIEVDYNGRHDRFSITVRDAATGEPIVTGRKGVTNTNLLRRSTAATKPPGSLALIDLRPLPDPPGLRGLGRTCVLVYLTPEDLT